MALLLSCALDDPEPLRANSVPAETIPHDVPGGCKPEVVEPQLGDLVDRPTSVIGQVLDCGLVVQTSPFYVARGAVPNLSETSLDQRDCSEGSRVPVVDPVPGRQLY